MDQSGYSVRVTVGTRSLERRFPPNVDRGFLRTQRAQLEADLRAELQQSDALPAERGTFAADVISYLKRIRPLLGKATYRSRVSELNAWTAAFSDRPRHTLRHYDVERVIAHWRLKTPPPSPKTVQNRLRTLRHVYRFLDGKRGRTPADDVRLPPVTRKRPRDVDVRTVRTVLARLIRQERNGRLRDAKTRARFMVRVTTGQRPGQIMATTAKDLDFQRRIWWVPTAKGGEAVPLYLNDDMLVSWRLFAASSAWGTFDTTSQARVLRRSGWPADVPVYNARHTVGIAFSERGEDLADIQAWMGHRHIQTTRDFYVPKLFSRLKAMSERADKRVNVSAKLGTFLGTAPKPKPVKRLRGRRVGS